MAFSKTGIAPVQRILCGCGQELQGRLDKCPKCGKTLIPDELRTPVPEKEVKDPTKS